MGGSVVIEIKSSTVDRCRSVRPESPRPKAKTVVRISTLSVLRSEGIKSFFPILTECLRLPLVPNKTVPSSLRHV